MEKPIYAITTNASEIIAGTANRVSPVYLEAARIVEGNDAQKSLAYLKSFAASIDKIAKERGRDQTLVASAGNIRTVKNYDIMVKTLEHLSKFLGANAELSALKSIHESLLKYQALYSDSYKLGIPLISLEYEAASSTLIRGISVMIVTQVDPQIEKTGLGNVRFIKVSRASGGVFTKVAKDIAKELSSKGHETYLKQLIDLETNPDLKIGEEQIVTEATFNGVMTVVGSVIDVLRYGAKGIKSIWNMGSVVVRSMFGIIPLIRTVIYLHYKKKADTVANLELQAQYLELNIQQLENIKTMDAAKKQVVIRKQQAYVAAYRKQAEKLRAQLMDNERAGSEALKADDANIKPSDDYVLD